ncbi:MAG: YggU family protein [Proteobacteria bacterium]|nr:YggU family protein [Pseudomonadota bacterium]
MTLRQQEKNSSDRNSIIRQDGNDLLLEVKIQPRASKNEVCGLIGDNVKIRITAAPVDGKANAHLVDFLAQRLKIAKSRIQIERGHQGKRKCIRIKELGDKRAETLTALGITPTPVSLDR